LGDGIAILTFIGFSGSGVQLYLTLQVVVVLYVILQQLIFVGKRDYSLDVGHLFKNLRLGLFITKSSFKSVEKV
jgi:hypothetical protein